MYTITHVCAQLTAYDPVSLRDFLHNRRMTVCDSNLLSADSIESSAATLPGGQLEERPQMAQQHLWLAQRAQQHFRNTFDSLHESVGGRL